MATINLVHNEAIEISVNVIIWETSRADEIEVRDSHCHINDSGHERDPENDVNYVAPTKISSQVSMFIMRFYCVTSHTDVIYLHLWSDNCALSRWAWKEKATREEEMAREVKLNPLGTNESLESWQQKDSQEKNNIFCKLNLMFGFMSLIHFTMFNLLNLTTRLRNVFKLKQLLFI